MAWVIEASLRDQRDSSASTVAESDSKSKDHPTTSAASMDMNSDEDYEQRSDSDMDYDSDTKTQPISSLQRNKKRISTTRRSQALEADEEEEQKEVIPEAKRKKLHETTRATPPPLSSSPSLPSSSPSTKEQTWAVKEEDYLPQGQPDCTLQVCSPAPFPCQLPSRLSRRGSPTNSIIPSLSDSLPRRIKRHATVQQHSKTLGRFQLRQKPRQDALQLCPCCHLPSPSVWSRRAKYVDFEGCRYVRLQHTPTVSRSSL